jgi:hypothetical protein
MFGWSGGSPFVILPPFVEGPARAYVEALFQRRSLCEGVADISIIDNEVLCGGNCLEQAQAGLIDTVCVGFIEDLY